MDDKLLDHHITETRSNFDRVHAQLDKIGDAVNDLKEFKVQIVVSARLTSILVSAALGLVTMAVSAYVSTKISAYAQPPALRGQP